VLLVCQPLFAQGKGGKGGKRGFGNQDPTASPDATGGAAGGGGGFGGKRGRNQGADAGAAPGGGAAFAPGGAAGFAPGGAAGFAPGGAAGFAPGGADNGGGGGFGGKRNRGGTDATAGADTGGGQFQKGGKRGQNGGAGGPGGGAGFQRGNAGSAIETTLKKFDTNNDNMIDAKEAADPNAKNIIDRIWERMGKAPHYPVSISELAQGWQGGGQRGGTAATASTGGLISLPGQGFGATSTTPATRPERNVPPGPTTGREGVSKGAPSTAEAKPAVPKLTPFRTPIERRPKGLPQWFIDMDKNGDGQITMAQYATTWTPAVLAEFNKYDLNHDGIITAAEVLKVTGGKATPAAAAGTAVAAVPAAPTAAPTATPPAAPAATTTSVDQGSDSDGGSADDEE
jgi:hypothetical protein